MPPSSTLEYQLKARTCAQNFMRTFVARKNHRYVPSHIAYRLDPLAWHRLADQVNIHPDHLALSQDDKTGRRYVWLYLPEELNFNYLEFPEPKLGSKDPLGPYALVCALPTSDHSIALHPADQLLQSTAYPGYSVMLRHFAVHAKVHSGLPRT